MSASVEDVVLTDVHVLVLSASAMLHDVLPALITETKNIQLVFFLQTIRVCFLIIILITHQRLHL